MIAFIIGSDRTGTNWIGKTLAQHSDITVTLECVPQFVYSWGMAANRERIPELFPKLRMTYDAWLKDCRTKVYVDKSHMNIWIIDELLEVYPTARFIATDRNPYATISSMLQHGGVRGDVLVRLGGMSMPNAFIGAQSLDHYMRLSLAQRCAAKWEMHHLMVEQLKEEIPKQLYVVEYERFAEKPREVIEELEDFLKLDHVINGTEVKHESVGKWKDLLSEKEIDEIDRYLARN